MKLLKFILCIAATLIFQGLSAQDIKDRTIRFAFQSQEGHPQAEGARKFAELVAQKSNGKLQVKLFPGGALGGDLQTISALQGGILDMTVLNSGILGSHVKAFAVFDFPFLFGRPEEADAVVDGAFGQGLLKRLEAKNLVGLAYWESGFRNLTNSKRPINKVEDIAGLKIRVIQSPIYIDMFNALGANPTPMPFPEVYTALEQKVVDGQENPLTLIVTAKLNEVQKYLTLTNHVYNPQTVLVSKRLWDQMTPTERTILKDAATETTKYQRALSREQADQALDELKKAGMQVTEFSPIEMQRLRDKVKPVIDKYTTAVGADTVQQVQSAAAQARSR